MTSSTFTRTGINWYWLGAFTIVGGTILGVGAAIANNYGQSIFANVGTAVLLLGLLPFGEKRLLRIFTVSALHPRTLDEATSSVRALLNYGDVDNDLDSIEHSSTNVLTLIRSAMMSIGSDLLAAGFIQCRPMDDGRYIYTDRRNRGISWVLVYNGRFVYHSISQAAVGSTREWESPRVPIPARGAADASAALHTFRSQVLDGLILVLTVLSAPQPRRSTYSSFSRVE